MVRGVREVPDGGTVPGGAYPSGDETEVVLRDGTAIRLRPIRGNDESGLLALYDRLSPESLNFRFFAIPDKDVAKAAYLAHVDYDLRYAVVAEAANALVGVARWERFADRPSHAEVAFTIADEFQGRGLGSILFRRLAARARASGIDVFEAEVLKRNERMLRLFKSSGLETVTLDQGNIVTVLLTLGTEQTPPA